MLRYLLRNVRTGVEAALQGSPGADPLAAAVARIPLRRAIDFEKDGRAVKLDRVVEAMEMGRLNFLVRTGVLKVFLSQKLLPIIGQLSLQLRSPDSLTTMAPSGELLLSSSISDWDDRFIVIRQQVLSQDSSRAVLAEAFVKTISFPVGSRQPFPPSAFFASMGHSCTDPSRGAVTPRLELPPLEDSSTFSGIVSISELDYNIHMNNARFFDVLQRARLAGPLPPRPVKALTVEYLRSLQFRDPYTVSSSLALSSSGLLHQSITNSKTGKLSVLATTSFH